MKNKLIVIFAFAFGLFTSCSSDDDTADVSKLTSFPLITLNGDTEMFITEGEEYVEPGANATEAGSEIELTTSFESGTYRAISGLNTDVSDQYIIEYSATNQDGFDGSAFRTIWVAGDGDFNSSIEGLYTSTVTRNGSSTRSDMQYIIVWKNEDGSYGVSDAIGGWYDFGSGYGSAYAAKGLSFDFDLTSNTFTSGTESTLPWGGTVYMTSLSIDPSAKTINFVTNWDYAGTVAAYSFDVTLTKVEF